MNSIGLIRVARWWRMGLWLVVGSIYADTLAMAQSNAQPFSSWSFSGEGSITTKALGLYTLPASCQLTQRFDVGSVYISIHCRPLFGVKAEATPILEVGPVGISFVRDASGGRIVVVGDKEALIPGSIQLDSDGRSSIPMEVSLYYSMIAEQATIIIDDAIYTFQAGHKAKAIEVTLSSGNAAGWEFDSLQVIADAQVNESADNQRKVPTSASDTAVSSAQKAKVISEALVASKAFSTSLALFMSGDIEKGIEVLLRSNRQKSGSLAESLESASKLIQVSIALRQKYDYNGSIKVARIALGYLDEKSAAVDSAQPQERAALFELSGYINGEIMKNTDVAREKFQQALNANPDSQIARRGIARLEARAQKIRNIGKKP